MMDDHTQPGAASEEEALRGLLHGAVEGLQPSAGALERLRHAVPARRARKRQALLGAAAVALLAGTAIPALMHLAGREGAATDHAAMAGHGEHTGDKPGAVGSDPHQNGSGNQPRSNRSSGGAPAVGRATGQPDATLGGSPLGGLTAGPSGTGSAGASMRHGRFGGGLGPDAPGGRAGRARVRRRPARGGGLGPRPGDRRQGVRQFPGHQRLGAGLRRHRPGRRLGGPGCRCAGLTRAPRSRW